MTGQRRHHSLLETLLNTSTGYGVAIVSQIVVFPLFGIHVPLATNFAIGGFFTVVSIVRGYFVRRLFNLLHVKGLL